jgi:very-short-patch-repair endonuclease
MENGSADLSGSKMPMNIIHPYRKDLVEKARYLRKNSTHGERALWAAVRNKKVLGYVFRRQRPIKYFIVDFYCPELQLGIEIDGSSHYYKFEYDLWRQNELEEMGIRFLRFSEYDARFHTEGVILEINRWIRVNVG